MNPDFNPDAFVIGCLVAGLFTLYLILGVAALVDEEVQIKLLKTCWMDTSGSALTVLLFWPFTLYRLKDHGRIQADETSERLVEARGHARPSAGLERRRYGQDSRGGVGVRTKAQARAWSTSGFVSTDLDGDSLGGGVSQTVPGFDGSRRQRVQTRRSVQHRR